MSDTSRRKAPDGLYRAVQGPFVCGYVVEGGRVRRAAPKIYRLVMGFRAGDALGRLHRRDWAVDYVCP